VQRLLAQLLEPLELRLGGLVRRLALFGLCHRAKSLLSAS
jgi:hypothetical protein